MSSVVRGLMRCPLTLDGLGHIYRANLIDGSSVKVSPSGLRLVGKMAGQLTDLYVRNGLHSLFTT
jgi:hypothetical protein